MKLHNRSGEHWDGAVYEVDGCGTLLGFLVYDAALFHVVGHVGNVYAYFPKSPFQFADGEGVVEVPWHPWGRW